MLGKSRWLRPSTTTPVLVACISVLFALGCDKDSAAPTAVGTSGNVTVEANQAVSGNIGPSGGTLTTTSNGGVTYTLIVPAGAIRTSTAITMTPITAIKNLAVTELAGAVELKPSGLALAKPAALQIANAGTPGAGLFLVGFNSQDDADSIAVDLAEDSGGVLELLVQHFSLTGAAFATLGQIQTYASSVTPSSGTRYYISLLVLAALSSPRDFNFEVTLMRQWMDNVIVPQLQNASTDFKLLPAVGDYNKWLNTTIALATHGYDPVFQPERDRAGQAALPKLQQAVSENNQQCIANNDLSFASNVLFWQTVAVNFGIATAGNGLDRRTVLDGLGLQVLITKLTFPNPAVANQTQRLELQAGAKIGGNPFLASQLFNWELDISGSTADGVVQGNSDLLGNFEHTITPTGQTPLIVTTTACLNNPLVPYPDVCGSDILVRNFVGTVATGAYDGTETDTDFDGNVTTTPSRWWLVGSRDPGVFGLCKGNLAVPVPAGCGPPQFMVTATGGQLAEQTPTLGLSFSGTVSGGQLDFVVHFPAPCVEMCPLRFTGTLTIPVN